jgi:hypothetical protein
MTLTDYMRTVLLETQYALDHLLWAHRSESDRAPSNPVGAEQVCLAEFAARTVAIVRDLIDTDNRRRGPRPTFRPPSAESGWSIADVLHARRQARGNTSNASTPAPTSDAPSDPLASEEDDGVLRPDAISPSRMPLRRLKP